MKQLILSIIFLISVGVCFSQQAETLQLIEPFSGTFSAIGSPNYSFGFSVGKLKIAYDTTVLNKGLKTCNHDIVGERKKESFISCAVYHGATGCPNDWMNQNYICTICLYHFNIKETREVIQEVDKYEEALKRLQKIKGANHK